MAQQVVVMFALVNGNLDDVEIPKVAAMEQAFHNFMESNHRKILETITGEKALTDEIETALKAALDEFKTNVPY